jgi:hypothetical protein
MKHACKDCKWFEDGWDTDIGQGDVVKMKGCAFAVKSVQNVDWHPIFGDSHTTYVSGPCMEKNKDGNCPDFKPITKEKPDEQKNNRQTKEKETWTQKSWDHVKRLLHK